jgi:replicative DNA helicase
MATASDHGRIVLSAILPAGPDLPGRRDLLEKASRQLNPDHFAERVQARLFAMMLRYSDYTSGGVLPLKYLDDQIRDRLDPAQAALFTETYELYAESSVDDGEFAWSVQQLRELASEKATGEALTEAMEILRNGKQDGQETLRGHEDAREYLLESLQAIDRDLTLQDAPEGDMRAEGSEMLTDYAERRQQHERGTSGGVLFGIEELDRKVGGLQNGELILAAGYSSDGKTTLCVQTAWAAAVEQGKNVVFLTTETLRPQVRRKLLARHSKLPIFNLPDGLNTRDLKAGTLPEDLVPRLSDVVADLTKNPAYGRLYIAQVPRSATIASIEQRLNRIQRQFHIDLVVMDYLALLKSDSRRQTTREELATIMKEAKLLAVNFDDSRGVPFMSPWQVSRKAREEAASLSLYTSASLSETAEATNSADVIISLLAPEDNTNRHNDITMQVLKNRDGETANGILVEVDYATSWFRSKSLGFEGFSNSAPSFGGSDSFGLDSLLPD